MVKWWATSFFPYTIFLCCLKKSYTLRMCFYYNQENCFYLKKNLSIEVLTRFDEVRTRKGEEERKRWWLLRSWPPLDLVNWLAVRLQREPSWLCSFCPWWLGGMGVPNTAGPAVVKGWQTSVRMNFVLLKRCLELTGWKIRPRRIYAVERRLSLT